MRQKILIFDKFIKNIKKINISRESWTTIISRINNWGKKGREKRRINKPTLFLKDMILITKMQ